MMLRPTFLFTLLSVMACSNASTAADTAGADNETAPRYSITQPAELTVIEDDPAVPAALSFMVVAGGCFWCVESDFEHVEGVAEVWSGYSGGTRRDASYRDHGDHLEAAMIFYDPATVTYESLAHDFLRSIDVTDAGGQFCDRGHSYTTALFYRTNDEKEAAEAAVAAAEEQLGREIVTPILPYAFFVTAEDAHQNYYKSSDTVLSRFGVVTKAEAYKGYRRGCGRDARVQQIWGNDALRH